MYHNVLVLNNFLEDHMHISAIKLDHVYLFTKSGNEVRVKQIFTEGEYAGTIEVERVTSGKAMIVTAAGLEEVPAYELD
jgi:hypothetical protein